MFKVGDKVTLNLQPADINYFANNYITLDISAQYTIERIVGSHGYDNEDLYTRYYMAEITNESFKYRELIKHDTLQERKRKIESFEI